jgi:putative transposase
LQIGNGDVFIAITLDQWAYENRVIPDFSLPGRPTDNPHIEFLQWKIP